MKAIVTGGTRGIGAAIAYALRLRGYETFEPSRGNGYDLTQRRYRLSAMTHCEAPDVVVNNVGGGGRYGEDEEVLAKNVYSMIDFTNWALPRMVEMRWGRVITISSIHGREFGSRPIFMAAKAAQIAYMKGLSRNTTFARAGITFNTVCPGNVYVEGKPKVDEEALPMGRMGKPEEVAKLVAFLCSDDAAWINGSCITIDGGESTAI
jgi:NAD(P)-dependent dehydrogenase (short-subunit alcohol dehydrogenase family)